MTPKPAPFHREAAIGVLTQDKSARQLVFVLLKLVVYAAVGVVLRRHRIFWKI